MAASDSVSIANEAIELRVATGYGPRITGLFPPGAPNLFAELGSAGIDLPGGKRFFFRGGHRLWAAPETPTLTYEPDDEPVHLTGDGLKLIVGQGGNPRVQKTLTIELAAGAATVSVGHGLTNRTGGIIEVAPWAITQFRPGGVGLLPLPRRLLDRDGLRANTSVIGWAYTDWASLGYDDQNQIVEVGADRTTPTKVGTSFARGWLGYRLDDWLFVKTADVALGPHADLGAQAQIYCNADFLELETQAAMVSLRPGASVEHTEIWRVHRTKDFPEAMAAVERS